MLHEITTPCMTVTPLLTHSCTSLLSVNVQKIEFNEKNTRQSSRQQAIADSSQPLLLCHEHIALSALLALCSHNELAW